MCRCWVVRRALHAEDGASGCNETELPTQDVTADDVASCKSSEILPQYKINKQRFARVLHDPVQNSLLTEATVAPCQMP